MVKRIIKIILIFLLAVMVAGTLYFISMDFRWSDKKFTSKMKEKDIVGTVDYVSSAVGDIRYVQTGRVSGKSIVFLHGAPGSNKDFSRYMFDKDLTGVANLITIDRPGYGYSLYGEFMPSIHEQAQSVEAAIPSNSIIVGHSYGGPVAAALAMYYPEKVSDLILLAPAVDPESEKQFTINKVINHPLLKWTLSGALKVALDEKLTHEESLLELMNDWASIDIPVTVVHGAKDNIVPFENMAFLESVLTNAHLEFHSPDDMNHIMIWTEYNWVKGSFVIEDQLSESAI